MDFTDYTRETLKGIGGVTVIVETLNAEAEAGALDLNMIQEDVESKLSGAGVNVFSRDQWRNSPGKPWLYISVNAVRYLMSYFFSIDVQLKQDVTLSRNPSIITSCSTWEVGSFGFVDAPNMPDKIREHITRYDVDKFIDDYKSLNKI